MKGAPDVQPPPQAVNRRSRPRHRRICGDAGGDLGISGGHYSSRWLKRK